MTSVVYSKASDKARLEHVRRRLTTSRYNCCPTERWILIIYRPSISTSSRHSEATGTEPISIRAVRIMRFKRAAYRGSRTFETRQTHDSWQRQTPCAVHDTVHLSLLFSSLIFLRGTACCALSLDRRLFTDLDVDIPERFPPGE